jgi:hypothetical protein
MAEEFVLRPVAFVECDGDIGVAAAATRDGLGIAEDRTRREAAGAQRKCIFMEIVVWRFVRLGKSETSPSANSYLCS